MLIVDSPGVAETLDMCHEGSSKEINITLVVHVSWRNKLEIHSMYMIYIYI